jgi:peroxiredoxin
MTQKIFYSLFIFHLMVIACSSKKERHVDAATHQVNEYPNITLTLENGGTLPAREMKGKNLFVLFQPDCDHCQEEAAHFEERLGDFKDYTLYFISSSPMENIMNFAKTFNLDAKENVKFAWTSTEGVLNHYGPIQTPSVYIYSDGKLKKAFNGQTKIENIVAAL